jgi:hypothetical protein
MRQPLRSQRTALSAWIATGRASGTPKSGRSALTGRLRRPAFPGLMPTPGVWKKPANGWAQGSRAIFVPNAATSTLTRIAQILATNLSKSCRRRGVIAMAWTSRKTRRARIATLAASASGNRRKRVSVSAKCLRRLVCLGKGPTPGVWKKLANGWAQEGRAIFVPNADTSTLTRTAQILATNLNKSCGRRGVIAMAWPSRKTRRARIATLATSASGNRRKRASAWIIRLRRLVHLGEVPTPGAWKKPANGWAQGFRATIRRGGGCKVLAQPLCQGRLARPQPP